MRKKLLEHASVEMQNMLESVYNYNSDFISEGEEKSLEKILFAMSVVDRKFFTEDKEDAYINTALSIGEGQTISQPSTVARMLLLAELEQGDDVLEVGAGSGWNAALIRFLVYPGNVISADRIGNLVKKARQNVSELRNHLRKISLQNVEKLSKINFVVEDALFGEKVWKKKYDKIIITAGIAYKETEDKIEKMAKHLLKRNGILVCPYVEGPFIRYKKNDELKKEETEEQYVFVPLLKGEE